MQRDHPVSAIALIDASPVLLLPSALALKHTAGTQAVHLDLLAPCQFRPAAGRLAEILRTKGINACLPAAGDALRTLEQQLTATWGGAQAQAPPQRRVRDVYASTGGTAARAVAALEQAAIRDYDIGWFCEDTGSVRVLSQT